MQRSIVSALAALLLYPAVASADTVITTTTTTVVTDDGGQSTTTVDVTPYVTELPTPPQVGATLGLGVMMRGLPSSFRNGTTGPGFPTAYSVDDAFSKSFWFSFGIEKPHFVFMTDMAFGGASISGTTAGTTNPPFSMGTAPYHYTGTMLESSLAFRIGAREQIGNNVVLEAGAGIGGALRVIASSDVDRGDASVFDAPTGPAGPDPSWFIPVWADATYRVSHDWSLELLAESDRDGGSGPGSTTIGVGMKFQSLNP